MVICFLLLVVTTPQERLLPEDWNQRLAVQMRQRNLSLLSVADLTHLSRRPPFRIPDHLDVLDVHFSRSSLDKRLHTDTTHV